MRTKNIDLDDIGFIGDGRPITEEETRLASEHIQTYKAKHPSPKHKPAKRGTTNKRVRDAVKSLQKKPSGAEAKLKTLDDIGHIGGERPYTEEDARGLRIYSSPEGQAGFNAKGRGQTDLQTSTRQTQFNGKGRFLISGVNCRTGPCPMPV